MYQFSSFFLLFNIIFTLGCYQKKSNKNIEKLAKIEINKLKSNIEKTRFQYPKKDSANLVFYLKKYISSKQFKENKEQEIKEWNRELKKKYNLDFKTKHFSKYFNIAYRSTDAQANHLEYITKTFFKTIYEKYFRFEPEFPFQIVYFSNKKEFEKYTNSDAYGFYRSTEKTLYTYTGSGEGTLWHELVHAFVDANIDHDIQQWFSEGFASFYEMASIYNHQFIEGYTNWRLPLLQKMLKRNDYLPLSIFLEEEEMSEDNAYAKARFIFCYLWVHNQMLPFVKTYLYELSPKLKGKKLAQKVIQTIEKLVGKSWKSIEKEYEEMAFQYKEYEKMKPKK